MERSNSPCRVGAGQRGTHGERRNFRFATICAHEPRASRAAARTAGGCPQCPRRHGDRPYDRLTWLLETFWVIVGIPLVLLTWRRFPLTTLLCCLLAAHALILIYGGLYTYARTPLGNWVRDTFGLDRNPYDRLGHFTQGFVPAILVRELLVRLSPLRGSRWLAPLVVCACLAFSAFFETDRVVAALIGGSAADDFLATQGDQWDTQWDMFLALIGSVARPAHPEPGPRPPAGLAARAGRVAVAQPGHRGEQPPPPRAPLYRSRLGDLLGRVGGPPVRDRGLGVDGPQRHVRRRRRVLVRRDLLVRARRPPRGPPARTACRDPFRQPSRSPWPRRSDVGSIASLVNPSRRR